MRQRRLTRLAIVLLVMSVAGGLAVPASARHVDRVEVTSIAEGEVTGMSTLVRSVNGVRAALVTRG